MKYLVIAVLLALSGCATVSRLIPATATVPAHTEEMSSLQDKLTTDLTQAIADAQAAKDPMAPTRAKCYQTILSFVPAIPTVSAPAFGKSAGVFDTFEHAAELAENTTTLADFQIPADVRVRLLTDCGPLVAAANDLLLRFNLRLARVAGSIALLPK